ncbi:MAG: hypothetical protein IPP55_11160 [Anaerolineales bacterium]|nr:hypothetical protein [Anaerolineales bacterium]
MKKNQFFVIFILTLSFLTACAPRFPQVMSFYISPFELTADEKMSNASLALSPNGESVFVSASFTQSLANLETAEKIDLRKQLGIREIANTNNDMFVSLGDWSFDGEHLGIPAKHFSPYAGNLEYPEPVYYVFNLQDSTYKRFDFWAKSFSPFDSNQIFNENGVFNTKDGTTIPFPPDFDFRREQEFGVTSHYLSYLWSKSLGVPVAQTSTLPRDATLKDDVEVVIESFVSKSPYLPAYTISTGFISKRPNQLSSGLLFDPTGEYILISEWQCHESPTPCSITPFHADNVYDTVLTLVRWRTQERQELIRLSEIDPGHVVAYGYMAWSADGSTIFISRKDASPIVLKLK